MASMAYDAHYHDSESEDEHDRSAVASPTSGVDYDSSHSDSEVHSNDNTPTTYTHVQSHASPTGIIIRWTAADCADFVTNLGLGQYAEAMIEESIDGLAIIALQHEDLKEMGVTSVGHRLTILKSVYQVKLKQNIPIEPEHYVPLSAEANAPDANATQDDVARIIDQIKLRDERIRQTENDLQAVSDLLFRLQEEHRKFREDVLPVIRMAKDKSQPLPTPEGQTHEQPLSPHTSTQPEPKLGSGLARKFSTKKLFLGSTNLNKMPSPTIHESSSLEPSAAAMQASSHLTASMSSTSQPSPRIPSQPSPTSPPYMQPISTRGFPRTDRDREPTSARTERRQPAEDSWTWSNASTLDASRESTSTPLSSNGTSGTSSRRNHNNATPATNNSSIAADDTGNFMKSFRVSMDEPCEKVLPLALKKYHINEDWRQYSLYIVHGDQERCLGLHEKPLILYKQLSNEGRKPMFMLRRHATPLEGFNRPRGLDTPATDVAGAPTPMLGAATSVPRNNVPVGLAPPSAAQNQRVQSYASSMQLPGGVL